MQSSFKYFIFFIYILICCNVTKKTFKTRLFEFWKMCLWFLEIVVHNFWLLDFRWIHHQFLAVDSTKTGQILWIKQMHNSNQNKKDRKSLNISSIFELFDSSLNPKNSKIQVWNSKNLSWKLEYFEFETRIFEYVQV